MDLYLDFLRAKTPLAQFDGYEISDAEIHPLLKPHQRAMEQEVSMPSLFDALETEAAA